MAREKRDTAIDFSRRQLFVHRRNLIHVCRLAVKTLVDKSRYETIDDSAEEFVNFAAILEQILNHRIKQRTTWYGSSQETKTFWDFARLACKRVTNNCLGNVEGMEELKTGRGKGRAWIRMALMEKKLSEYVVSALQQTKIIKTFYDEGAIMLSEESHILAGILLGLNSIDFSFCLKGENLEIDIPAVIDYTPYLKYPDSTPDTQSLDGGDRDFNDSAELISSIISGTESAIDAGHDSSADAELADVSQADADLGNEAIELGGGGEVGGGVRRNLSNVSLGLLDDGMHEVDINGNNGGTGDSGVGVSAESYFLGSDSPPPSTKSMDSISLSTVDTTHETIGDNNNGSEESVRTKYKKLEAKYKTVCEQKGYLEELVRLRESQLEDAHKQRQKLVDTIQNFEGESRKERQQLEGIIIELQAQLSGSPLPSRDVDELCWDALTPAQVFGSEDDLTSSAGVRGFLENELKLHQSSSTPLSKAERKKLLPENNWLKTLYKEISSGEKQDNEESEKARLLRRVGDAARDAAASTATPQQQQIMLHQQTQNRLMQENGGGGGGGSSSSTTQGENGDDGLLDGEGDEDGEQKKVVPEEAEETFRKLRKANDKAIRYSLHRETLMKYLDKDLVPRGLRINLVPTIGNQVEDFVTNWRDTLHTASKGLMELIVEFCTKEEAKLNVEIMKLQAKLYDMINDTHQLAETSNLIANLSERARERLTRRKERKLERDEGDMMTVRDNRTGEVITTLKSHNPLMDPPLPASTHQKNYGHGAELFYGEPLSLTGLYHPSHYQLPFPPLQYVTPPPSVKDDSANTSGGGAASDVGGGDGERQQQKPVDPVVVEKSKMNPNAKPFEAPKFQQPPSQPQQPLINTSIAPPPPPSTSSATSSSYMIISQDFSTPVASGIYVNTNYPTSPIYASNPDLASSYATVGSALPYGTTPILPSGSVGGGSNYNGGGGRDGGSSGGNRGGRQYRGAGSGRLHGGRGGGGGGGGSSHTNGNSSRDGGRESGGGGRWESGSGGGGGGGGRGGGRGGSNSGGDYYRGGRGGGGRSGEPGTPSSRHRSSQHGSVNNGLGVLPNGYSNHYTKKQHGAAH